MLLKALYDLSERNNLLRDLHVQQRSVHLLVPISAKGELLGNGVISLHSEDRKGKTVLGRDMLVPRFPGENNGGKAYFLAESCTYVFGIESPSGTGLSLGEPNRSNSAKSFLHFWEQIEVAEQKTSSPVLGALLRFREHYLYESDGLSAHRLPFVEMRESIPKGKQVPEVSLCVFTVAGKWIPLAKKLTVSFQVDGMFVFRPAPDDSLHNYWRETYRKLAFLDAGEDHEQPSHRGLCMVTQARDAPIARSHKPKILRIPNLSSGGYLVSFARECPSFSSFGFQMGENAPISEEAAAAYALGLQWLLDSENHSVTIGPSVICFWARSEQERTGMFAALLDRADPRAVRDFLNTPWKGIDRGLAKRDQFYCVTFTGNAGRVVVRHWMQMTLENAVKNLASWFTDLEAVQSAPRIPREEGTEAATLSPLAIKELAKTTVSDEKKIAPMLCVRLYRAAIEGTAIPVETIHSVLGRLRTDISKYGPDILFTPIPMRVQMAARKDRRILPAGASRFALMRLILNRNRKGDEPMIEPQVFETDDDAYNCGRLLAVLAEAQERAHEFKLEGAGIAERYFGTASVSPCSVLPLLIRLNRHHLEKIKKSDQYGHHARFIEKEIRNIMALFVSHTAGQPPEFPRYLDLKKQGRFALGFYQQKAKAEAERKAAKDKKEQERSAATKEEQQ